jgi:pimeloyl-ACP methyl ester carboxylesterase
MDRTERKVELRDGRSLGYAEYGRPEGSPVFYFHGFPGTRISWPAFDPGDSASRVKARIIAVDRPGMGLSGFKRGRTLLNWPDDVAELAERLKLDRFAVLGISGGGPYAAACAFKIPERLTSAAIVCGMGPPEAPGCTDGTSWTFPGEFSVLRRLLLSLASMTVRKTPDKFIAQMMESVSVPDAALLRSHPEVAKAIVADWQEAFRPGICAVDHESAIYSRPWGFQLQDIDSDVHLWHGEQDQNVVGSVGHYVADAIPNCRATFLADEGHFSVIFNRIEQILRVLVA